MSQNDSALLKRMYEAIEKALGKSPQPIEAPIEEEVVIKSYNESEEGVSLENNEELRKCLEVVCEPYKRDAHQNWYTADTIKKGYESYEKNKDNIPANLFHLVDTDSFTVDETFILEEDTYYEAIDDTLVKGTWMAWTHYPDDELWELKKSGELGGLSPACLGKVDKNTGEITHLAFTKEDFYAQLEEGNTDAS